MEAKPSLGRTAVVVGVVVALVAGAVIGRLVAAPGPVPTGPDGTPASGDHAGSHGDAHGSGGPGGAGGDTAGGLSVSASGYTLVLERATFAVGVARPLRFRIIGRDGAPVTRYATVHERPMHLIVVRRDLSEYQHLHPQLGADGTWSAQVTLPAAGMWRAFADFSALDGDRQVPVTLGVDVPVAGMFAPSPLPAPARTAAVAGYQVRYAGALTVGVAQPLLFTVAGGGRDVTALQPYLGAYGHLVAIREGDLAYLHVHPDAQRLGAAVRFWVAAPSPGTYRMYFDFKLGGAVRTAEFTVTV